MLLDISKNGEDLLTYLNKRDKESTPETQADNRKRIEQNSIMLANNYDDIWWWEANLTQYIHGDMAE